MTGFERFLDENYEMTMDQFINSDEYTKNCIEREWEAYI